MIDLTATFAALVQHHVAMPACPLPEARPGLSWIWASGGIFKRGISDELDVLIPIERTRPIGGLARLLPHVRFRRLGGRLPGALLAPLLEDARRAGVGNGVLRPSEKQYFFAWRNETIKVVAPTQDASAVHIRYAMPPQTFADVHSHHEMRAYFSTTDDRDDTGLSVSAVIGRIFTRPEIRVRLNVWGDRWEAPPSLVFDALGPFRAAAEGGQDADA